APLFTDGAVTGGLSPARWGGGRLVVACTRWSVDAARRFLERLRVPAERVDVVWDAIALHTSMGIATRKRPEIALVAVGSGLDFTGNGLERIPSDAVADVLEAFPRLEFKKAALDTVLSLCRNKPMGELMHPFAEVGRRHLPGFPVPTVEDLLMSAPFAE
ncbi:hypothetical protein ABZ760_33530, partial [Streptomyces sp. NPDC006658]